MIHVDYFNWVILTDINPVRTFHAQWPIQTTGFWHQQTKINNTINDFYDWKIKNPVCFK